MKEHFDLAFELTVGLEGGYENDPNDPGGETKYGICKTYHPNIDIKNLTLDQAKAIYYADYWLPAGCDVAEFPMDICLFDSQVNPQNDPRLPGGGNKEILLQNPSDWHEYMILRMIRYMNNSKGIYVKGHIFRVLRLFEKIKQHI